jgi:short-subunit dehydrogenase
MNLKNLANQIVVITGASSGIGLTTARMAAERGAKLVLAARSENALSELADETNGNGGEAIYVVADVGKREDVEKIAQKANERFGGFDTWINNSGIGIFGKIEDTSIEDMRQLFETNFWGVIYGSLEAVKTLKKRGGALINVGSVVSDQVVHLQGIYSSSKHAVKGFTDALRMELEADNHPVSVTLIQPSAINTPFSINAKNVTESKFTLPPPVYAPETVAEAILHCCENFERNVFVGGGGKSMAAFGHYAPRLMDKVMESDAFANAQKLDEPPLEKNALDQPSENLSERGNYEGHTMESSVYTKAALHPAVTVVAAVGVGLGLTALWRASQKNN